MKKTLLINLLPSFLAWQSMTLSYTPGQATYTANIPPNVRFSSRNLRAMARADSLPDPSELPLSIYILYFDQSSPKLRPGVKATLESIAQQLVNQPTLMATVTGYTDNVGKRELNMVLAEYRAKTVESYLKQHGVLADQIKTKWEGPDKNVLADDAAKTISRRVVIQLAPK
ncbi:OmpA family protein [Spirosoma sp. HMF4905]|uniref:OmpA family protein n=1 Tax=Spirosoma arboris TaxID=2682092 RepID=A0A7K1SDW6_9BACT|nr:OmpA family protein [Spirosoma arboris]MVM32007.1 OmpA family protein [Spirosoma arboris]